MKNILSRIFRKNRANKYGDERQDEFFIAACHGKTETIKRLINEGMDVHIRNDFPLRAAAWWGELDTVALLLEMGADPHACDGGAARDARERGHNDVAEYIENWIKKSTQSSNPEPPSGPESK